MKNTKSIFFVFFILQIPVYVFADYKGDSLIGVVQEYEKQVHFESDTNYIQVLIDASEALKLSAPDSSLLFGQKAYHLSKKHGYSGGIIESAFVLSAIYTDKGDKENLLDIGNEILPIVEKTNRKLLGKVYNILGTAYLFEGMSDNNYLFQAKEMYQKALEVCETYKDTAMIILTLTNLSAIQSNTFNYNGAIESLYRAIGLVEISGQNSFLASTLFYNVAMVYYEQKKYDQALVEIQKATQEAEKDNDISNIAHCLHLTAFIYKELNKPDEALDCINRCIDISHQLDLTQLYWRSKEIKSLIYNQKGLWKEALETAEEVLKAQKEIGSEEDVISIKETIAEIYFLQKQYNKSLKICNEILETKTSNLQLLYDVHRKMSSIYEAQNKGMKALEHFKLYKTYSDSLFISNLDEQIVSLKTQNKYEQKEQELRNEQTIREAEYAKDKVRLQIIIAFVLVLFFSMLIFLLFIMRSRKKIGEAYSALEEANYKIQLQKEEISSQSEELRTTNEHLVQLVKFKQDITGMIVHDLKNPLSTMLGLTTSIPDERRLSLLHDSAQRMLNLVLNILDINKYEDSKLDLKYSNSDINSLIESVTNDLSATLNFKKLNINLRLQDDLIFSFDRDIIRRVLDNILNNAIKFSPSMETIFISTMRDEDRVWVTIRNTGPSIPSDMQEVIFEPYGRIDRKENDSSLKSTGLGLTFCKIAVAAHQGTIGVESSPGKPTDFWFEIPYKVE